MPAETFVHNGVGFRVSSENPDPRHIMSGQWVRIYGPTVPEGEIFAEVISCELFWRGGGKRFRDDFRLTLAQNGNPDAVFQTFFTDQYLEIVEPLVPKNTEPLSATEHMLRQARVGVA